MNLLAPKEYLREERYKMMEEEFTNIMKLNNWTWESILDIDSGCRLLSFLKVVDVKGRYYFRYGIVVLYMYDIEGGLLEVECWQAGIDGFFVKDNKLISYWNGLLKLNIPWSIEHHCAGVPYKVKFICSYPPFVDEGDEIIGQDVRVEDGFGNKTLHAKPGFFVLVIKGCEYICKSISSQTTKTSSVHWCRNPVLLTVNPECDEFSESAFVPLQGVLKRKRVI